MLTFQATVVRAARLLARMQASTGKHRHWREPLALLAAALIGTAHWQAAAQPAAPTQQAAQALLEQKVGAATGSISSHIFMGVPTTRPTATPQLIIPIDPIFKPLKGTADTAIGDLCKVCLAPVVPGVKKPPHCALILCLPPTVASRYSKYGMTGLKDAQSCAWCKDNDSLACGALACLPLESNKQASPLPNPSTEMRDRRRALEISRILVDKEKVFGGLSNQKHVEFFEKVYKPESRLLNQR